ncbi:MAG TPA: hypothetical protein VMG08_04550 [Allosphingosinicella sp.]|nr:hypothetical protein [Allosphingosinicella sp.]
MNRFLFSLKLAGAATVLALVFQPASASARGCGGERRPSLGARILGVAGAIGANEVMRRVGIRSSAVRVGIATLLGEAITCHLNEAEQQQAAETQMAALNSGATGTRSTRRWTSARRSNINGSTMVVSRSTEGGNSCAMTRTLVTNEEGQEVSVERELCQGQDGQWAAV